MGEPLLKTREQILNMTRRELTRLIYHPRDKGLIKVPPPEPVPGAGGGLPGILRRRGYPSWAIVAEVARQESLRRSVLTRGSGNGR